MDVVMLYTILEYEADEELLLLANMRIISVMKIMKCLVNGAGRDVSVLQLVIKIK
jgi:hypothetical protein